MKLSSFLLLLLFSFSVSFAQDKFTCYTETDGLTENNSYITVDQNGSVLAVSLFEKTINIISKSGVSVLSFDSLLDFGGVLNVITDQQNNYYVATGKGIIKYDGKVFSLMTKTSHGLISDDGWWVDVDMHNKLWYGTLEGLSVLDLSNNQVTNISTDDGLISNSINKVDCEADGNCYISYSINKSHGVTAVDLKDFSMKHYVSPDVAHENIWTAASDTFNKITYLGTFGTNPRGAGIIGIKGASRPAYNLNGGQLKSDQIRALHYSNELKKLLVCSQGGLTVFDNTAWKTYGTEDGLNGLNVSSATFNPKKDTLWVGLQTGICYALVKDLTAGIDDVSLDPKPYYVHHSTIYFTSTKTPDTYTIFDATGRLVKKINSPDKIQETNLKPGTYIINVEVNGKAYSDRFVVTE